MNNSKINSKGPPRSNKKQKLVLVRAGALYGLSTERKKTETVSINRGITSTPTFVFYSNNTKCFIDYTNQTNKNIEKILDTTFEQVPNGTTFEMFNGTYTDPNSLLTSNLSGIYTFRRYEKGIIVADVNSGQIFNSKLNRYDKTRFDDIPYFKLTSLTDGVNVYTTIKNRMGVNTKNSFNYLGVKPNDYLKLTGYEKPYQVLEINVDSDGNEYVLLNADLPVVDNTSNITLVEVYISTLDKFSTPPDLNETELGACLEYKNGEFISCANNHTVSQCRFRSSEINQITTEISLGTFCRTPETTTALQSSVTENLVQITSSLVNAVTNANSIAGPLLKNNNSKNAFYGRPF